MTTAANYTDEHTCKSCDVWAAFIVAAGVFALLALF
jgi:hypothetical protein